MLFFYQKCVYIYRQFRSKRRLILNDLVTKYREKRFDGQKADKLRFNLIPNKIHINYEIKNYNLPTKSYNVYTKCF